MHVQKIMLSAFSKAFIKDIIFNQTEQYAECFTVSETKLCISLNSIRESHCSNKDNTLVLKFINAVIRLCDIIIINLPSVQFSKSGILIHHWKVINYSEEKKVLNKDKTFKVASKCFCLNKCNEAYWADSQHLLLNWHDDLKKSDSVKDYLHVKFKYWGFKQLAVNTGNQDVSVNDL